MEATIKLKLRKAVRNDFATGSKVADLVFGTIFFLKRESWEHVEGPYSLAPHHVEHLAGWFKADMLYVKDVTNGE